MQQRRYRKEPRDVDAVLRQWMTAQGFYNSGLWRTLGNALREALPVRWHEHVQLCRVAGSQASIAVDSAALLAELKGFHASRLRVALQNAAPRQGLRDVKFILGQPTPRRDSRPGPASHQSRGTE